MPFLCSLAKTGLDDCEGFVTIGIPTTYREVRFRSRLEARWAAMFDALKWPWSYEPADLDGYIPDFAIGFEHRSLLVEVKPAVDLDELALAEKKIERSGWQREALIVGGTIFEPEAETPVLGLFGECERTPEGLIWLWSRARAFECLSCGGMSVLPEDGSWRCRACGVDGGNSHLGFVHGGLRMQWAEAGNRVQWRAA